MNQVFQMPSLEDKINKAYQQVVSESHSPETLEEKIVQSPRLVYSINHGLQPASEALLTAVIESLGNVADLIRLDHHHDNSKSGAYHQAWDEVFKVIGNNEGSGLVESSPLMGIVTQLADSNVSDEVKNTLKSDLLDVIKDINAHKTSIMSYRWSAGSPRERADLEEYDKEAEVNPGSLQRDPHGSKESDKGMVSFREWFTKKAQGSPIAAAAGPRAGLRQAVSRELETQPA